MSNSQRQDRAHGLYSKSFKDSTIADTSQEFPKFSYEELTLGQTLGEGGFGVVSEIRAFKIQNNEKNTKDKPTKDEEEDEDDDQFEFDLEMQGRQFIADHCLRNDSDARYAIKLLKPELAQNEAVLIKGLADMVIETHILSAIEHPNIVKLRAISAQQRYHPQYFIVMDRLYDTLQKRIPMWAQQRNELVPPPKPKPLPRPVAPPPKPKKSGGLFSLFGRKKPHQQPTPPPPPVTPAADAVPALPNPVTKEKLKTLLEERLVALFDLAAALSYLHDRKIIYRDIKPENCAFDVRGDIKLFDFGTSKELPEQNDRRDKTFQLTGVTGSLPYMAPEVAATLPYNHKADVFSYSVMLWHVMALESPFSEYESDLRLMWEEVHNGPHKRPNIPQEWPKPIELCLKRGWAKEPSERMEMKEIEDILKKEIVQGRQGNDAGLRHDRRRSTFVFRR